MMKTNTLYFIVVYALFAVSGSLFAQGEIFALGEKTLILGGETGWAAVEGRRGIVEASGYRPHRVLILDSSAGAEQQAGDLILNFDEGRPDRFTDAAGHYQIMASSRVQSVSGAYARFGTGAVLFTNGSGTLNAALDPDPLVISPANAEALLFPDKRFRDFTLEFWLNPVNMETGEQILYWSSVRAIPGGNHETQWIQCVTSRNRLQWTFHNFFSNPGDDHRLDAAFSGISAVTPQRWSRHQIHFDADTGALEYLVDGRTESIVYVTATGREGGEVYTPIIGQGSRMVLGGRYSGFMDEFRFRGSAENVPSTARESNGQKFPAAGGWIETGYLDLGEPDSRVMMINARGGFIQKSRAAPGPGSGGTVSRGERVTPEAVVLSGGSRFSFPDNSVIRFFIRTAETPWPERETDWIPTVPGAPLDLRGRYVQIRAEFYPSGDGENTPYLDEISLTWLANEAPRPPAWVVAVARDGAVDLSWGAGADKDTQGYLVYYGTSRGEYFGTAAKTGASPLDVGKRTSLRVEGLTNGVLYYFAVSAYDLIGSVHAGEFSREVLARPLRMIE
jgi:hypothetical protein